MLQIWHWQLSDNFKVLLKVLRLVIEVGFLKAPHFLDRVRSVGEGNVPQTNYFNSVLRESAREQMWAAIAIERKFM